MQSKLSITTKQIPSSIRLKLHCLNLPLINKNIIGWRGLREQSLPYTVTSAAYIRGSADHFDMGFLLKVTSVFAFYPYFLL